MPDPVARSRRREKIVAIAATADYNPHEAANAAAMLATMPETQLEVIAQDIHSLWGEGIDKHFAVGRRLVDARNTLGANRTPENDSKFGQWFRAQSFPFSLVTAHRLRTGAEREAETRLFIASHSTSNATGKDMGVATAIEYMSRKPKAAVEVGTAAQPDSTFARFRAGAYAVLDWKVNDEGEGAPTSNGFLTMHVDDLADAGVLLRTLINAYQEARYERSH